MKFLGSYNMQVSETGWPVGQSLARPMCFDDHRLRVFWATGPTGQSILAGWVVSHSQTLMKQCLGKRSG